MEEKEYDVPQILDVQRKAIMKDKLIPKSMNS